MGKTPISVGSLIKRGIVLAVVGLGGHCRLDLSDAECQSLWDIRKSDFQIG